MRFEFYSDAIADVPKLSVDGTVDNAWPGLPAFVAGVSNSMKIVAVNGRRFSNDEDAT